MQNISKPFHYPTPGARIEFFYKMGPLNLLHSFFEFQISDLPRDHRSDDYLSGMLPRP